MFKDNFVVMEPNDEDAITETLHITKSEANEKRLQEAIDELNNGVYHKHDLIED